MASSDEILSAFFHREIHAALQSLKCFATLDFLEFDGIRRTKHFMKRYGSFFFQHVDLQTYHDCLKFQQWKIKKRRDLYSTYRHGFCLWLCLLFFHLENGQGEDFGLDLRINGSEALLRIMSKN